MPFYLISTDPHPNTITPITNPQTIILNGITYWLIPEPYQTANQSAVASTPTSTVANAPAETEQMAEQMVFAQAVEGPSPFHDSFSTEEHIIELINQGLSRRQIMRRLHVASKAISEAIYKNGIETPFAKAVKAVEEALANAGPRGLTNMQLNQIARAKGQTLGPLIMIMKRSRKMYKLSTGNWTAI